MWRQTLYDDPTRPKLRAWVDKFEADLSAKLTFLSLPEDLRQLVRNMGTLSGDHLSGVLMNRVRTVYNGYVDYDPLAKAEWAASRPKGGLSSKGYIAESVVVVVMRGESHREGNRTEHFTTGSMEVFGKNVRAYMEQPIDPLEKAGHTMLFYGDLRCAPLQEQNVRNVLNEILGKPVVDVRVQKDLLGFDQVSSVMSCWDFILQSLHK